MEIVMTKETIYYSRMFGHKGIHYTLETKTMKTSDKEITTYYYATFGEDRVEIGEEEYECLLEELKKED